MADVKKVIEIIDKIAVDIEDQKHFLTELDNVIGDGDHGINMARGFKAVQEVEPGTDEIAAEAVPETGLEGPDDGWTRTGLFASDNGYMFSISWMDSEVDGGPGWYIAAQLGEDYLTDSYGGFVKMEDGALKGTLTSGESEEAVAVTISEEGEDGLVLAIDGADSYQFAPMDWEDLIEDYTDDSYYYEYEEETGESEA